MCRCETIFLFALNGVNRDDKKNPRSEDASAMGKSDDILLRELTTKDTEKIYTEDTEGFCNEKKHNPLCGLCARSLCSLW